MSHDPELCAALAKALDLPCAATSSHGSRCRVPYSDHRDLTERFGAYFEHAYVAPDSDCSWEAAGSVLEACSQRGFRIRMEWFKTWRVQMDGWGAASDETADELPNAIARAAEAVLRGVAP